MANATVDTDRAALAAVGVLAVSNVASNRVLPIPAVIPWNVGVALALVALARRAGVDDRALGLHRQSLAHGLHAGAVAATAVAGGYAALLAGGSAAVLDDRRATEMDAPEAWWHGLVGIPLGTVLVEEVAFRGVLPALLASPTRPAWVPGTVSSMLFGLWHVLPAQDLVRANARAERMREQAGRLGATVLAVAAATAAGGVLHRLRRSGRHLAAPALAHLASNVLGLVTARRRASTTRRTASARL